MQEVHDLHIWPMSTREPALTAHLVVPLPARREALLEEALQGLHEDFSICHCTIQVEGQDLEESLPCL